MSVPYVNVDKMKRHAINRLSKHFGRTIDVTADLVNGSKWIFTAHLGTGRGYSDDFILYPYLENLTLYARNSEECCWINKFVADVIDYERNCEKMHTSNEHVNLGHSIMALTIMLQSYAMKNQYEFNMEHVPTVRQLRYTFTDPKTRDLYCKVLNVDSVKLDNVHYYCEDIIGSVRDTLGKQRASVFKEYCRQEIKSVKLLSVDLVKHPDIKDVIFNNPATIVLWEDGTKTVVKATEEEYDPEKGLAMAIAKKRYGNKWSYYNVFKHWLKKYKKPEGDYEQVTYTTKLIMEED